MKILVQGDLNRLKKIKKFSCDKCGCVFLADQNEYRNNSNQHDGTMFSINCPCCDSVLYNYSDDCVPYDKYI